VNKVQRLELAGAVAPALRNATEKTKSRRIGLIDANGNVVGYTTGAEALRGLAKIQELEHAVTDDTRPTEIVCRLCGKTVYVRSQPGRILSQCSEVCMGCVTPGCDGLLSKQTARKVARLGAPPRCPKCARSWAASQRQAARTPEQRAESMRRVVASKTPECHAAAVRKSWETRKANR
jgi:hypothetical protein